jgi:PPP family 3-phenylpropionic acid transporter
MIPGFAARLSGFYAAFFVVVGIHMPFFPLWLQAKGLDARTIGFVLAVPMVVRIAAIPVATALADRHDAVRAGIVVSAFGLALGYLAVGLSDGVWMIFAAYTLAAVTMTPILPLADAYALKGLPRTGRSYGQVRLWGSVSFIVGSLGAGLLLDVVAPIHLIWFIVASAAAVIAVALVLEPLVPEPHPHRSAAPAARRLLRQPVFLAAIAAASLIQASHAVYYGFSALDWRAAGFDGATVGALWAIGVIAEIVLFALAGRLPAAVTPAVLLMVGGLGGIVRWAVMAFDPPAPVLPLLQCMHALSFGATHLGAIAFIGQVAPPGLGATAQGYLSVAAGAGMAVATGLSGVLYAAYGAGAYAAMALCAAIGLGFALLAHRSAAP